MSLSDEGMSRFKAIVLLIVIWVFAVGVFSLIVDW